MLSQQNIERVYRGQPALVGDAMVEDVLSPKQFEVASVAAEGGTYVDVAEKLDISFDTVRSHLHATYVKLDIFSKPGLAPYFPIEPDSELLAGKKLSDIKLYSKRLSILEAVCIGECYKSIAFSQNITTATARTHIRNVGKEWENSRGALVSARIANGVRARCIPVIEADPERFGQHDIGKMCLKQIAELEPLMD